MTDLEKRQHELLKSLEWSQDSARNDWLCCPVCQGCKPHHEPPCKLQATLALATLSPDLYPPPEAEEPGYFVPTVPECHVCKSKAVYLSPVREDGTRTAMCPKLHEWTLVYAETA